MKENCLFSREQVNRAIAEVMVHQYKKDCKDAHAIVEAAGYDVFKNIYSSWEVMNKETGRRLYCSNEDWKGNKHVHKTAYYGKNISINRNHLDECKVDFVGCLDCNRIPWHDSYDAYTNYRPVAVYKYSELKMKKNRVIWREEDIEKKKKEIEKLQADLIRYVEYKEEAKANLKAFRKELGLIR